MNRQISCGARAEAANSHPIWPFGRYRRLATKRDRRPRARPADAV